VKHLRRQRRSLVTRWLALACGALLGCGGQAGDRTSVGTGDDGLSATASLPAPAAQGPTVTQPAATEPSLPEASSSSAAGGGSGGGAGSSGSVPVTISDACTVPDDRTQSDFVVMTFANETSETLYLASTNPHCGAWPAYVELSQNGSAVDIYGGDCVPYCSRFRDLDYQTAEAEVAGCAGPTPCPTPFRAIPPGQQIYQMVFPWQDTHYALPSSCVSGATEASVECVALRDLPDATYSLRATAYRGISCGDAGCTCERTGMLDWCTASDGAQQPQGTDVALHADAVLQLGSPVRAATLVFR
jgi:hypothetical protein